MENNYLLLVVTIYDGYGQPCGTANIPILPFADASFLFQVAKRHFNSIFDGYDYSIYLCPTKFSSYWKFYTDSEMNNFLIQSHKIHAFHYVVDALMSRDFQKSPYLQKRVRASRRAQSDNNNSLF